MACNDRNQSPITALHRYTNALPCRKNMCIGLFLCNMVRGTLLDRPAAPDGSEAGQLVKTAFSPPPNDAKSVAINFSQTAAGS